MTGFLRMVAASWVLAAGLWCDAAVREWEAAGLNWRLMRARLLWDTRDAVAVTCEEQKRNTGMCSPVLEVRRDGVFVDACVNRPGPSSQAGALVRSWRLSVACAWPAQGQRRALIRWDGFRLVLRR